MSESEGTEWVRRRIKNNTPTSSESRRREKKDSKVFKPFPTIYFIYVLTLIVIVFTLVIIVEKRLPRALTISEENDYPDKFIAERAYNILKQLASIGPRIAGSYENEVIAVNFLSNETKKIIRHAHQNHVIEIDIQKASGDFNLEFLDGMTNVYQDVQNVIVKVGSRIKSNHSLLINCHFDTVMDSPGASDDGAGCAVMMEILRVLTKSEKILRHNIIFLFNGGEENFMPASHGFITQHKWAKEVRAFINLEACGAGGREILFQAGPHHPWILETYSHEVPYPYASSLAQEIFQSGVIPGDTDYRIFRDFGNISGLDFAWSSNGYVYHTKHDNIEQIPPGSLQRTGDNILALAIGMAQGHQLAKVQEYKEGNLVFFDFLGAFVVRWPMLVADLVNVLSVIFSLYSLYGNMVEAESKDYINKERYCKKLIGAVLIVILSWILSIGISLFIASNLEYVGRTMSWYARPVWAFFLYVIPTLTVCMATILVHSRYFNEDLQLSPWSLFQLYYDAYQLIWTIVLTVGLYFRIRSSFIPLIWILGATSGNFLKSKLYGKWRDPKWLFLHIGVMALPFVQSFYLMVGALYLFIPVMGRAGAGSKAEHLMSVLISIQFSMLLCFAVPLILLVRRVERVFSLLLGMFLISMAVLLLTPLGFPYSGDPTALAPQRFMIAHTHRIFHDEYGAINNTSSGFWIVDMDINSPHTVDRYVPEMERAMLVEEDCKNYLYCGLPYLVPVITMLGKTHWLPGPTPVIPTPINMTITSREKLHDGERVFLKVTGPTHIGVMISPVVGVEVKEWSLHSKHPLEGPLWNGRKTYFIYYAYGSNPVPLRFSIDFKIPSHHSGSIMDLAVTSHYQFGKGKQGPHLRKLVDRFPTWTAVTSWTATYESWII